MLRVSSKVLTLCKKSPFFELWAFCLHDVIDWAVFTLGKYAPEDVKVLPLDLASGEEGLKGAVERAVSLFPGAGVDYLVHNAAYERPVSNFLAISFVIYSIESLLVQRVCRHYIHFLAEIKCSGCERGKS